MSQEGPPPHVYYTTQPKFQNTQFWKRRQMGLVKAGKEGRIKVRILTYCGYRVLEHPT